MKTLQECKDEIAKAYGYNEWKTKIHENGDEFMENIIIEVAALYATEACREQREICAEHAEVYYPASNNLNPTIDPKSIKNAPEPKMI